MSIFWFRFRFWTLTNLFRLWSHDVSVSSRLIFLFPRPSSRCSMQQYMVCTVSPWCHPLRSIICSTWLLATCFYFLKPLALIMFMDVAVWWDLDVSLSEQETSAIFRMFMDAVVGWVLDVSLSKQQTCAIYIFLDNVHSRCSRMSPRCWTTKTCAIYVDNVHGRCCRVGPWRQTLWTRNVCYVELFSSASLLATWLFFSNPPMKFEFLKVEDVLLTSGSPTSDSLNNKRMLSGGYWILFSNPPLKFELDKVDGRCWRVGPRCQNLWLIRVLSEFYFCSPWILATRLLFFNPLVEFDLIKLRDAADWSVPEIRISKQYVCYLNFIFVPREC
jgi:hypothetical protein